MCRRSQPHVMDEQLSPIEDVGAGVPPVLARNRLDFDSTTIFMKENHIRGTPARAGRSRLHLPSAAVLAR
jgi:hypothetical protein